MLTVRKDWRRRTDKLALRELRARSCTGGKDSRTCWPRLASKVAVTRAAKVAHDTPRRGALGPTPAPWRQESSPWRPCGVGLGVDPSRSRTNVRLQAVVLPRRDILLLADGIRLGLLVAGAVALAADQDVFAVLALHLDGQLEFAGHMRSASSERFCRFTIQFVVAATPTGGDHAFRLLTSVDRHGAGLSDPPSPLRRSMSHNLLS